MRNPFARILGLIRGPSVKASVSLYDGATQNAKRAKHWYAPPTGPNAVVANHATLRNRAIAAYRNSPFINNGIEKLVSNEIGKGITPRSESVFEGFKDTANELWLESVDELDAEGQLSIYGLQAQMCRARLNAGEVYIRFRPRKKTDGLAVPLQVQVLESEYCPSTLTKQASNGNQIKCGIEFNGYGRRVAYWMYKRHPSDIHGDLLNINNLLRVPASQVVHHYSPLRPGQVRGEPGAAQSLLKNKTLDSYDDAELLRKETRAPFTGFLKKTPIGNEEDDAYLFDPFTGAPRTKDADSIASAEVQAGTILEGLLGEELELFDGDKGNESYAPFMRQQMLAITAGLGIPYEIATGDYKDVNDRVIRAINNEFRRWVEMLQDHLMIHQVCRRIWEEWCDAAVLSGALSAPGYADHRRAYIKHVWRPQGWRYLHPEQDINAKLKSVNGGLSTLTDEIAQQGGNIESVVNSRVKEIKLFKAAWEREGLGELDPLTLARLSSASTTAGDKNV